MTSTTSPPGINIYFHLVPLQSPMELIILAGQGDIHDYPTVSMPYDLFTYFLDTFRLIPVQRAVMERVPMERPIITAEGAQMARQVFAAWKQMFSLAGEEVILTTGAGWPREKECFRRDQLVSSMAMLESFCSEIEGGEKIIYFSDAPDFRKLSSAKMRTESILSTSVAS